MEFNEYQVAALRTNNTKNTLANMMNAILGLNGEAGELADLLKKHLYQGHELDVKEMINELGDVLWYCALLAEALDEDLGEVAKKNIEKLMNRYPNGFEKQKSIERTK